MFNEMIAKIEARKQQSAYNPAAEAIAQATHPGAIVGSDIDYFEATTPEDRAFDNLRAQCGGNFNFYHTNYDWTPGEDFFKGVHIAHDLPYGAELHINATTGEFGIKLANGEWMTFERNIPEDWGWF